MAFIVNIIFNTNIFNVRLIRNDELLTNKKLRIKYGELRNNTFMNGVFARDNIEIGEVLLTFSNLMGSVDTVYTNKKHLSKYAYILKTQDGKEFFVSTRLNTEGKPTLPEEAVNNRDLSMGVFINEPSIEKAYLKNNKVIHTRRNKIEKSSCNVCPFVVYDTILMVSVKKINKNEELLTYYGDNYKRDYAILNCVCKNAFPTFKYLLHGMIVVRDSPIIDSTESSFVKK